MLVNGRSAPILMQMVQPYSQCQYGFHIDNHAAAVSSEANPQKFQDAWDENNAGQSNKDTDADAVDEPVKNETWKQ